jgi:hypothetical protein
LTEGGGVKVVDVAAPALFGQHVHLLYVFAGAPRKEDVSDYLQKSAAVYGYTSVALTEIDIVRDPDKHDVLQNDVQKSLLHRAGSREFAGGLFSPLCSSWSRLRFSPHGPPPIRSAAHPWGFPWLEGTNQAQCKAGNTMIEFTVEMAYALHAVKSFFLIEHPEDLGRLTTGDHPASIWQTTEIQKLAKDTGALTCAIFQCDPDAIGANACMHSKPTRFMGTVPSLISTR